MADGATGSARVATEMPDWLRRDLRSDHAGEAGAVAIYRGILAVSRDASVREFAQRHMATESRHLSLMEELVPPAERSRLLPLWYPSGFLLGALPALFGARAVYATIGAVESFVDGHYAQQIDRLSELPEFSALRETLSDCRDDELEHRDDALDRIAGGALQRAWSWFIGTGSAVAVWLARRF